jgi:hypothetical protein
MKKIIGISLMVIAVLIFVSTLSSCTKNQRVKRFGGSATIELPAGQKLIHCTWKDANLWYLTRPMNQKDSAEVYTFQEKSNFGMVEGTYIIKEQK